MLCLTVFTFYKNLNLCEPASEQSLGVRWMGQVRNEDLWERANQMSLEEDIKKKRRRSLNLRS